MSAATDAVAAAEARYLERGREVVEARERYNDEPTPENLDAYIAATDYRRGARRALAAAKRQEATS